MSILALTRNTLGGLAVLALALLAGFFVFCASLPREGTAAPIATGVPVGERGIIVLTGGGGERIERGLALHAEGHGDRVLITGVHPQTTKKDLGRMGPAATLECCVDLGPYARSTRGNAVEGRDWLRRHGYRTVLLVTSDFHLPRATLEMKRTAPDVEIIGVPVASAAAPETGWMGRLGSWRILGGEYAKFLVVRVQSLF